MKKSLIGILIAILFVILALYFGKGIFNRTQSDDPIKTTTVSEFVSTGSGNLDSAGMESTATETTETTEISTTQNLEDYYKSYKEKIDLSLKPNELGEVMVLMYHYFEDQNSEFGRTPEDFRADLKRLYDMGFRTVSMSDYINSNYDIPAGTTPVVLTFDDGHQTQFNYIAKDGVNVIDPECAVAILEEFYAEHPEFGKNAIFYINGGVPFGQSQYYLQKLDYLIENGYEIGNHTWEHKSMSKLNAYEIQESIGLNNHYYYDITGLSMTSLALPYGDFPKEEYEEYVVEGEAMGMKYKNEAIFMVGWRPSWPLYLKDINSKSLYRVQSGDLEMQLTWWLDNYEKAPENRFISDGVKEIITIPSGLKDELLPELLDDEKIYIYDLN